MLRKSGVYGRHKGAGAITTGLPMDGVDQMDANDLIKKR